MHHARYYAIKAQSNMQLGVQRSVYSWGITDRLAHPLLTPPIEPRRHGS